MGTRGLIGFKVDGKYSGYYNQYEECIQWKRLV